jgi:hypothetical protein
VETLQTAYFGDEPMGGGSPAGSRLRDTMCSCICIRAGCTHRGRRAELIRSPGGRQSCTRSGRQVHRNRRKARKRQRADRESPHALRRRGCGRYYRDIRRRRAPPAPSGFA